MVPHWSPELFALDIGLLSYVLIYTGGLVFLTIRGVGNGVPGGITIPRIFLWMAISILASVVFFLFAAQVLLGES